MKPTIIQAKVYQSPDHFQNVLIEYEAELQGGFFTETTTEYVITYIKVLQRIRLKPSGLETDLTVSIEKDIHRRGIRVPVRLDCTVEEAFTSVRV